MLKSFQFRKNVVIHVPLDASLRAINQRISSRWKQPSTSGGFEEADNPSDVDEGRRNGEEAKTQSFQPVLGGNILYPRRVLHG
jgi:hypothetical protein